MTPRGCGVVCFAMGGVGVFVAGITGATWPLVVTVTMLCFGMLLGVADMLGDRRR